MAHSHHSAPHESAAPERGGRLDSFHRKFSATRTPGLLCSGMPLGEENMHWQLGSSQDPLSPISRRQLSGHIGEVAGGSLLRSDPRHAGWRSFSTLYVSTFFSSGDNGSGTTRHITRTSISEKRPAIGVLTTSFQSNTPLGSTACNNS